MAVQVEARSPSGGGGHNRSLPSRLDPLTQSAPALGVPPNPLEAENASPPGRKRRTAAKRAGKASSADRGIRCAPGKDFDTLIAATSEKIQRNKREQGEILAERLQHHRALISELKPPAPPCLTMASPSMQFVLTQRPSSGLSARKPAQKVFRPHDFNPSQDLFGMITRITESTLPSRQNLPPLNPALKRTRVVAPQRLLQSPHGFDDGSGGHAAEEAPQEEDDSKLFSDFSYLLGPQQELWLSPWVVAANKAREAAEEKAAATRIQALHRGKKSRLRTAELKLKDAKERAQIDAEDDDDDPRAVARRKMAMAKKQAAAKKAAA